MQRFMMICPVLGSSYRIKYTDNAFIKQVFLFPINFSESKLKLCKESFVSFSWKQILDPTSEFTVHVIRSQKAVVIPNKQSGRHAPIFLCLHRSRNISSLWCHSIILLLLVLAAIGWMLLDEKTCFLSHQVLAERLGWAWICTGFSDEGDDAPIMAMTDSWFSFVLIIFFNSYVISFSAIGKEDCY